MKKEITIANSHLHYNGVDLFEVATRFPSPLKLTFLDITKKRVQELKEAVDLVISKNNYSGKFLYLNANKANYGVEEIGVVVDEGDGVECSSYYDLLLSKEILTMKASDKPLYCNGFKTTEYMQEIVTMIDNGYNVIPIIDSMSEYNYYTKTLTKPTPIGLRIHLSSLYEEEDKADDRFGLTKDDFNYILNDLQNHKCMTLEIIHFHQRGFEYEEDKFVKNIALALNEYYIPAKIKYQSVSTFDIGGGTPLPTDESFDYTKWATTLINTIKEVINGKVEEPNIASENGKYAHKDSSILIYEVVGIKNTAKDIPWYIINGCFLTAMLEHYCLGEPMMVRAVNLLDKEFIPTRLAGLTCDCDDVYTEEDGAIMLPRLKEDEKLYIAIIGTGSYQDSMRGLGGVHHCLIPEEHDVLVTNEDTVKFTVRRPLQTIEMIKKQLFKF